MFKLAFNWLYSSESTDVMFPFEFISLGSCLSAKVNAVEESRRSLNTYRVLNVDKNNSQDSIHNAQVELQRSEQYVKFLEKCEGVLKVNQDQSIHAVMLTLTLADAILQSKSSTIFAAWLDHDSDCAFQFYENYSNSLLRKVDSKSPKVKSSVGLGKVAVDYFLKELQFGLKFQKEPLAICRVLAPLSAKPLQFAACLVWMMERGIQADTLVKTGLLHHYVEYYFDDLYAQEFNSPFNEVVFLYDILNQFASTKPLVKLAEGISCSDAYVAYNLHGKRQHNLLIKIDIDPQFPSFTRNKFNVTKLIEIFGQSGLIESVSTLFKCLPNDSFDAFFIDFIHGRPNLISPALIRLIAEERSGDDLRKIAYFVDDTLFQQWLNDKNFIALYLLPQKPHWIGQVGAPMMNSFLQLIGEAHQPGSEADTMALLSCLYKVSDSAGLSFAETIYEVMIALVLEHRYLLNDNNVFNLLKSSIFKEKCVIKNMLLLTEHLDCKVDEFISGSLIYENFSGLRSKWDFLLNQLDALQFLCKRTPCLFPQNPTNLIVLVFKKYAINATPSWDLLVAAMGLRETPAEDGVISEYNKQVLLTVLANVDHVTLRSMIIDTLALAHSRFCNADRSVLLDGIAAGNIGFVDWYLEKNTVDDEMLDKAIFAKQWPMVEQWFIHHGIADFSKPTMDRALIAVAGSGRIRLLNRLVHDPEIIYSTTTITAAFICASSNNDPISLRILYQLHPYLMGLRTALSQSVQKDNYQSFRFFQSFKNSKPQLAFEVERAFNSAVNRYDFDMIVELMKFSANAPSRKVIQVALERAMDKAKVTGKAIEKSTDKAMYLKQLELVDCLKKALHPVQSEGMSQSTHQSSGRKSFYFPSTTSLTHLSEVGSPIDVRSQPSRAR